ncbi:MAG: hypothetical protein KKD44_20430 [Proteobacteria bacterium]|nr:hypothetical protein [Pseudomonadota bacterium]
MNYFFQNKREWVNALVMGCPFGQALPDCPLTAIRKESPTIRFKQIKSLTDVAINVMIAYHKDCLGARERELLK